MKVIKNWLEQYTKLELTDNELINIFSSKSGFDVDEVVTQLDVNVVVAKIIEINKHPNADKLRLVKVSDGTNLYDIVCGAPNIAEEMIVPLAKIGAKIGDMLITEANIRGEKSYGMLCSGFELGINQDREGIMSLNQKYVLGEPLAKYFTNDTIFDLEITPNRGDCLSHIGIAREIAAAKGANFSKSPISLNMSSKQCSDVISIDIVDNEICPRYCARVIEGVKIAPSPQWLQDKLKLLGLSPINNVVDATNFIMFDLGQPLHAFDLDKINNHIVIRSAKKSEIIQTLDGNEYKLDADDIIITDKNNPIALAGIMGGFNSGIQNETKNIVLESAEFNSKNIRKTAKRLGISTDASYRFERGIDSGNLEYAINSAAKLIKEIAGGSVLSGIAKSGEPFHESKINLNTDKINKLLGISLSDSQVNYYLKLLGFKISGDECIVPSWRKDINLIEDLAEEVGRIHGYDLIPELRVIKSRAPQHSTYYFKEIVKDVLVSEGFSEQYSYPFMSNDDTLTTGLDKNDLLEVTNPVQQENKFMRISLASGLLKNIAKNGYFDNIRLFEINPVYHKNKEDWMLIFGLNCKKVGEINAVIRNISKKLKISEDIFTISSFKRDELLRYKIKKPLVEYVEISISDLIKNTKISWQTTKFRKPSSNIYRPVSKFPSVTRDLAFILDKNTTASTISDYILKENDFIINIELFDEFVSDKLGKDKKNIAFHIFLQAPDRTLKDDEASEIISNIIKNVNKTFNAKLRDK